MKTMKRIVTLALALMMAFSTLVMPAMAANEDEGIMPHVGGHDCPNCAPGYVTTRTKTVTRDAYVFCSACDSVHRHIRTYLVTYSTCDSCGYYYEFPNPELLSETCDHP